MNILFLGDVVAKSGREAVVRNLAMLKEKYSADLTVVNAENAAHGKGITPNIYKELTEAGADVLTLGNHAYAKKEIVQNMDRYTSLVRPANIPGGKGRRVVYKDVGGIRTAVVNLLGNVFMSSEYTSPFAEMEKLFGEIKADVILVDFHAEATSEKILFAEYFKDRLTAVIGTHTHVQTADERILNGCAYITDAGMCGPYDSILGRDKDEITAKVLRQEHTHYKPSDGAAIICGAVIRIDETTKRAAAIERVQIRPDS